MFWGLILKANKKYTQTLEKPFHLSQAALDHLSSDDQPVQVMYSHEDSSYLLCTLQKGKLMQCALDLNFAEGDKLCFLSRGNGIVHLTGYLVPEDDFNYGEFGSEEEEEGSETELPDLREKLDKNKKRAKIAPVEPEDDSESEDEEDEGLDESALNEEDDEEDSDESEEDDSEDDDEEDDSEQEITPPKAKQPKLEQKQSEKQKNRKQQQNGTAVNGQDKSNNKQKPEKTGGMQKLQGGLMYQDTEVGNGGEAKPGKKVQVYYTGRLKSNNKVFDQAKPSGPGFKFILGRGEVIKAWDLGITGMKVGGKRRLICPPQLAYGHKGNPPVIPPNATLVFDVELKNVY